LRDAEEMFLKDFYSQHNTWLLLKSMYIIKKKPLEVFYGNEKIWKHWGNAELF
jgi:hypothetical protein